MSDARYTTILYEVVEDYGYTLFNFNYILPDVVDKEQLELLFYKKYYFREIGSETIDRWLLQFEFKWQELCSRFYKQFEIFHVQLLKDDIYNTSDIKAINKQIFNDTPKSKLTSVDYATNTTDTSGETIGYSGSKAKYEMIIDYASRLKNIYMEMIEACEPLFMQLY